ncbi:MAG TPA: MoaD/ThiS family protein [Candidatus Methanofastidiosa archaeon]|nr:MoaD/ThiS family protein [Candidatus Methanofastidiosa archaeon]
MRERRILDISYTGPIRDLLPLVDYGVETAVVLKNGSPVEEEEEVTEGDEIKIVPVVSGG